MVGADHFPARVQVHRTAQLADRGRGLQEVLGGDRAQAADVLRVDQIELPEQEPPAVARLFRRGVAVARRAALEHVEDVHVVSRELAGLEHLREELPRTAHERLAEPVLVGARRFAHEAEPRFRVAHTEHRLGAGRGEFAARFAAGHLLLEHLEGAC